jgi:hypothetical protein
MMTKRKITSMKGLRREKRRLALQMEQEKAEISHEVEVLKEHLWPLKVLRRFRKTAETISENKFVILGAQLAYAILNATWKKNKKEENPGAGSGVLDFLKGVVQDFLSNYVKTDQGGEKE